MKNKTYYQQQNIDNTFKLRELRKELPQFLDVYFRGIEQVTASRTRIAYAIDIKVFFEYVIQEQAVYGNDGNEINIADVPMNDLPLELLDAITAQDIEGYLEHLKAYKKDGQVISNDERGIKRKLASLRSMYQYYHKHKFINTNPVLQVSMPKLHDKAIVRLDIDEIVKLLDSVESGEHLTKKQLESHQKTKIRDLALLTLFLGTGIRVSECVGLDQDDVDFNNDRIKVIRKGGYESFVYFGDEVRDALLEYFNERKNTQGILSGHENALFLSTKKQRITVRSVELLVKKYAVNITTMKKITPHKLRSTYGTALYQETGDIYLVADVLGHKDVNTTRKHYAALDEERRRIAKDKVILRER